MSAQQEQLFMQWVLMIVVISSQNYAAEILTISSVGLMSERLQASPAFCPFCLPV
jgi:hypothetical protein